MDLNRLRRLCTNRLQPMPCNLLLDGALWTVASDGHFIVAIPGLGDGLKPAPEILAKHAIKHLSEPAPEGETINLASFKAWLEPPQWPGKAPCKECGGTGKVECRKCRGQGIVDCECTCGDDHEAVCPDRKGKKVTACWECEGSGKIPAGTVPKRPGRIAGTYFNRELLARMLDDLEIETITLAVGPHPEDPIRIWGHGYRAMLMPYRVQKGAFEDDGSISIWGTTETEVAVR